MKLCQTAAYAYSLQLNNVLSITELRYLCTLSYRRRILFNSN